MHLGVVAKRDTPRAVELADRIRQHVDAPVSLDTLTASEFGDDGRSVSELSVCDLVVSIGGDGTFLFTAREVAPTPIMGVNLGEVGFLNAVSPDDAIGTVRAAVERIRRGDADFQKLTQIKAEGDEWSLPPAVNEIAVLGPQRGRNNGATISVSVDGSEYSSGHADGVLFSTSTGSTAYNLSEDGPLIHPDVAAFVLTEMCGTKRMPSLAVPIGPPITVDVETPDHGFVVADGRTRERIDPPASVTLSPADAPVRIAGPRVDFFKALKKLE